MVRFVDLLFGHPFRTPSPEEYAMYQASAVTLRSSDNSRQVGAAIVNLTLDGDRKKNTDVVAVGMNEVPRRGGGFYWDQDSPDHRDQALLLRNEDRLGDYSRWFVVASYTTYSVHEPKRVRSNCACRDGSAHRDRYFRCRNEAHKQ